MVGTIFIGYPQGSNVNIDYYLNKHMALAWEHWGPSALGYKVSKCPDPNGPYEVVCAIEFSSLETAQKTLGGTAPATMKQIMDDLKNYSEKPAVLWMGESVGEKSNL